MSGQIWTNQNPGSNDQNSAEVDKTPDYPGFATAQVADFQSIQLNVFPAYGMSR